ncbi:MAG: hypothetical protein ACC662_02100, partial [Planctomycetota bacterium]
MIRILASGCLAALLFLLGSTAWAGEPTAPPAPLPGPGSDTPEAGDASTPPGGGGAAAPPVTTMAPEQGGTLLGQYYAGKLGVDDVDRALAPKRLRERRSPWQGNVRLRYRFRNTSEGGTASDHDFYGYLKLEYRDEGLPGWSGSF